MRSQRATVERRVRSSSTTWTTGTGVVIARNVSGFRLAQPLHLGRMVPGLALLAGVVRRGSVDGRHLAPHRAQVRAELAAVVDDVEEDEPDELAEGLLQ